MRRFAGCCAVLVAALLPMAAARAKIIDFTGTRSNISRPGVPDGRCAPLGTVSFGVGGLPASGTSSLGNFSYTASQCVAGPPPTTYNDGQFTWTFSNGTLSGTYEGSLSFLAPGQFSVLETILFTGGTGRFLGASGSATATGLVTFGLYEGAPASFGNVSFTGLLDAPGVPEPASWAMLVSGFALVGAISRRRQGRQLEGRAMAA